MKRYGVMGNESSLSVKANQTEYTTAKIKMEFELAAINEADVSKIRHELEEVMRQIDAIVFGLYQNNSDKE